MVTSIVSSVYAVISEQQKSSSERQGAMYARVTSGQFSPAKMEEAIQIARESVIPAIRQQKGYLGFTDLIDRETGKVMLITRFETQADMQAGMNNGFVQQQLAKIASLIVGTPGIELYEVLFHE